MRVSRDVLKLLKIVCTTSGVKGNFTCRVVRWVHNLRWQIFTFPVPSISLANLSDKSEGKTEFGSIVCLSKRTSKQRLFSEVVIKNPFCL